MKKVTLILIFVSCITSKTIINLSQIQKEYLQDKNEAKFKKFKKEIVNYYESGQFESEVENICKNALNEISKLEKSENDIVIFDVDETALFHYPLFKQKNFNWSLDEDVIPYRQLAICPAIKPVLNFYKQLVSQNYKIIFLTSRRHATYQATKKNLIDQGYTAFEDLILLPTNLFDQKVKHHEWKANVRKELSLKYNIVASISDLQRDFEGGNTGYSIKIPNLFY